MPFNGPLRYNPHNPRYFTDDTGEAIYLTGSHTWSTMQDMWPEDQPRRRQDYAGFLQMMVDHGHNFLRFWQFALQSKGAPWNAASTYFDPLPFERTGSDLANDGLPKFDLTRINPVYMQRLRERIELAASHGIYTSVMLFEAWSLKWANSDTQPWEYHPFNPANNINGITDDPIVDDGQYPGNAVMLFSLECPQLLAAQKRFVRAVVELLNDMDNVLYEICNEVPNTPEAMSWSEHLVDYIRTIEHDLPKQHMIGITAEGGSCDNAPYLASNADWISPSNGPGFQYRYNPPAASGEKVILNDTDHLWGLGGNTDWVWKSFTRGMNVLFMDCWHPVPTAVDWWEGGRYPNNTRYFYLWDDMRRNLGYTRKVASMLDLNNSVPDLSFCTSTYCLMKPNQQYVCYFPAGGEEGLDLTDMDGTFSVSWLNPATGIIAQGDALTVRGDNVHDVYQRAAPHAPFDGPSVLILLRQE